MADGPTFECEDCIGMKEHGCYCMAMGCVAPCTLPEEERDVVCDTCGGDGEFAGYSCAYLGSEPSVECTACGGTGQIKTQPVTLDDLLNDER